MFIKKYQFALVLFFVAYAVFQFSNEKSLKVADQSSYLVTEKKNSDSSNGFLQKLSQKFFAKFGTSKNISDESLNELSGEDDGNAKNFAHSNSILDFSSEDQEGKASEQRENKNSYEENGNSNLRFDDEGIAEDLVAIQAANDYNLEDFEGSDLPNKNFENQSDLKFDKDNQSSLISENEQSLVISEEKKYEGDLVSMNVEAIKEDSADTYEAEDRRIDDNLNNFDNSKSFDDSQSKNKFPKPVHPIEPPEDDVEFDGVKINEKNSDVLTEKNFKDKSEFDNWDKNDKGDHLHYHLQDSVNKDLEIQSGAFSAIDEKSISDKKDNLE